MISRSVVAILRSAAANDDFQTSVTYTHIAAQPQYGFTTDQDEIQTRAQIKFKNHWSVFGTVSYDLNDSGDHAPGVGSVP